MAELKRSLSLFQLLLYGLGTTIGAGIYALIGEIAGAAGYHAPVSFLVASMLAAFTAISFAELGSRYPRAAGAALYVRKGFNRPGLSTAVGLGVIAAGLVSAAALVNGFVNHLKEFIEIDRWSAIVAVSLTLWALAAWGISQAVTVAGVITVVEVGGLLLVFSVSAHTLTELPAQWSLLVPESRASHWQGIYLGAVLSFYAFIGFEDMVDVAEEVRNVRRNLPRAILLTLLITTLLYALLMVTALLSVPPEELARQGAPLAYLYERNSGQSGKLIAAIGTLAIINGALIQIIMASRVFYGMASRGQLPALLGRVSIHTQTPLFATALAALIVLGLALAGSLSSLASLTSLIVLTIFATVNLALWRVKGREPPPAGAVVFPAWVPLLGFLVSAGFVLRECFGLAGL